MECLQNRAAVTLAAVVSLAIAGACVPVAADAVAQGEMPQAYFSARFADPAGDIKIEQTTPRATEEVLRKSDLSAVRFKVTRPGERVTVTYEVPEVHRMAGVRQIFATSFSDPTPRGETKSRGSFGTVLVALTARGKDAPEKTTYRRLILTRAPDSSGGRQTCAAARARIVRGAEVGKVKVSFPLSCLNRKRLARRTTVKSYSLVEGGGNGAGDLAIDRTKRHTLGRTQSGPSTGGPSVG